MNALTKFSRIARLAAIVAVVLVVTTGAQAQGKAGTLRFLAVGVSEYADSRINQLHYAHKDAQDLSQVWRGQQGKLYDSVTGETLVNRQATLANILAGLDRTRDQVKPGDLVVISFAGHGGPNFEFQRDPEWYFLPTDCQSGSLASTAISSSTLRAKLKEIEQRGATVILILDSCFSGSFGSVDGKIVVFAACMSDETSRESGVWQNGVYTKAFIEALQGKADLDHDGVITLAEVDAYVSSRVPQLLAQASATKASEQQCPACGRPTSVRSSLPLARLTASTGGGETPHTPDTGRPQREVADSRL